MRYGLTKAGESRVAAVINLLLGRDSGVHCLLQLTLGPHFLLILGEVCNLKAAFQALLSVPEANHGAYCVNMVSVR